jgi:hypothetical protein
MAISVVDIVPTGCFELSEFLVEILISSSISIYINIDFTSIVLVVIGSTNILIV